MTLISTRPTASGPNDADLPEHDEEFMAYLTSTPDGRALTAEIPEAKSLTIERMGHELPSAAFDEVVPAIVRHTS